MTIPLKQVSERFEYVLMQHRCPLIFRLAMFLYLLFSIH